MSYLLVLKKQCKCVMRQMCQLCRHAPIPMLLHSIPYSPHRIQRTVPFFPHRYVDYNNPQIDILHTKLSTLKSYTPYYHTLFTNILNTILPYTLHIYLAYHITILSTLISCIPYYHTLYANILHTILPYSLH